jgi:heme exporter protein D
MSFEKFMGIYWSKDVLLGYGGSIFYFIAENFDQLAGMVLSAIMILASILLQHIKIKAKINEERRKEERHQQELRQDEEIHKRNLNNS